MLRKNAIVTAIGLLTITACASVTLAQQDRLDTAAPNGLPPGGRPDNAVYSSENPNGKPHSHRQKMVRRTVMELVHEPISDDEFKQLKGFHAARQKLKDAKDEAGRKIAIDVMQKYLATQFEQDLAEREKELSAVEERLKALRQQLDKRKQAKEEIVSLRLKTIVNNVEGLGFPGFDESQDTTALGRPNREPLYTPLQTYDSEEIRSETPRFQVPRGRQ